MPHEFDVEQGEIGDNGYAHETWVCLHCGKVDSEFTPDEVERMHVTDLIIAGEVTKDELREESLEKDWIQEAFQKREQKAA